jgi:hypothetical protein
MLVRDEQAGEAFIKMQVVAIRNHAAIARFV